LNWKSGGCETGAFLKLNNKNKHLKIKQDFNRQPCGGGGFLPR
jgi:hypothetical protein